MRTSFLLLIPLLSFFCVEVDAQTDDSTAAPSLMVPSLIVEDFKDVEHLPAGEGPARTFEKGVLQELGKGAAPDSSAALNSFEAAAAQSEPRAEWVAGRAYLYGFGTAPDQKKGIDYLARAVQHGNSAAASDLAKAYSFGWGVDKNAGLAETYWKMGVSADPAQSFSYAMYLSGELGTAEAKEKAVGVIVDAARNGDPQSVWALTDYSATFRDPKLGTIALEQLKVLASKHEPLSSAKLGDLYSEGWLVDKNIKEAEKFYIQAANQGNYYAKAKLGELYLSTPGLSASSPATELIYDAARNGEPAAFAAAAKLSFSRNDFATAYSMALTASELGSGHYQEKWQEIHSAVCAQPTFACDEIPVFYITNRVEFIEGDRVRYQNRMAPNDQLFFGASMVATPIDKDLDDERKKDIDLVKQWLKKKFGSKPASEAMAEVSSSSTHVPIAGNLASLITALKAITDQHNRKKVLIYIHGFNSTFDDSIHRVALLSQQFKYPGIPIVMSWASAANSTIALKAPEGYTGIGYENDGQTVIDSCKPFRSTLEAIVDAFGSDNVMVVAHSMGGRLLYYMLTSCPGIVGGWNEERKLDNIVFAAPDLGADEFKRSSAFVAKLASALTLYVSANDAALRMSERFRGGRARAGEGGPNRLVLKDVFTIDATPVEDSSPKDMLNHAYVFEVAQAKRDLSDLLKGIKSPDMRDCPRRYQSSLGLPYWLIQPSCSQ